MNYEPVTFFQNLKHAMDFAYGRAPRGVCYAPGKGWADYNLLNGAPKGTVPEFVVVARGQLPIALTEDAAASFLSLVRSVAVEVMQ